MIREVVNMIKECHEHSFFRGDYCPICGKHGRFIMNDKEVDRLGRIIAGALRHFPEQFGLSMTPNGFVDVRSLASAIRFRKRDLRWVRAKHIMALALTDPKGRYEIREGMIRATYGHTIDVDLDLPTDNIPPKLYYPVAQDEIDNFVKKGIYPTDRKMVHLSISPEAAYEAGVHRYEDLRILEIDAESAVANGIVIKRAGKTVYITNGISPEYITVYKDGL